MSKLEYKIVGRRTVPGDQFGLDYVDVEWTVPGGVQDTHIVPVSHPPNIRYETQSCGKREVIHDQIVVRAGTTDNVIKLMLEEKKPALAKALGIKE